MIDNNRDLTTWPNVPRSLSVHNNDVHVFAVSTASGNADERKLSGLLASEELVTACRIKCSSARRESIVTRAALRILLSRLTGFATDAFEICRTTYGKPTLAAPAAARCIEFNVAHTGGLSLVAISFSGEVGVDVERVCEDLDSEAFKRTILSLAEQKVVEQLPSAQRTAMIYRFWTRKEAILKAAGLGLVVEPLDLDVSTLDPMPFSLESTVPGADPGVRWRLQDLTPSADYVGALACYPSVLATWFWRFQVDT